MVLITWTVIIFIALPINIIHNKTCQFEGSKYWLYFGEIYLFNWAYIVFSLFNLEQFVWNDFSKDHKSTESILNVYWLYYYVTTYR